MRQATVDGVIDDRRGQATDPYERRDVSLPVAQRKDYIPEFERETVMRREVPVRATADDRAAERGGTVSELPRVRGDGTQPSSPPDQQESGGSIRSALTTNPGGRSS